MNLSPTSPDLLAEVEKKLQTMFPVIVHKQPMEVNQFETKQILATRDDRELVRGRVKKGLRHGSKNGR